MKRGAWLMVGVIIAAILLPSVVYAATGSFSSSTSHYALRATNTNHGHAIEAKNTSNGDSLYVTSYTGRAGFFDRTSSTGSTPAIYAEQHGNYASAIAIYAHQFATGNYRTWGIQGRTDSRGQDSAGVYGYEASSTGNTDGVYGRSLSSTGTGVLGYEGADGATCGVCGEVTALEGIGLGGFGPGLGVLGSAGGFGVVGETGAVGDGSLGVLSATDLGAAGHIIAADGDVSGTCTVASGQTTVDCAYPVAFPSGAVPNVVITPASNPGSFFWVTNPSVGDQFTGFAIHLGSAPGSDVIFHYLVVAADSSISGATARAAAATHAHG